ncbi:MAG: hypothetical protein COX81_01370, partial [Candidatus Magasanikbacteria bacterium CG_4_10_14_0_2_um_filter_37_12]
LQNSAFDKVEEAIATDGRSTEDILRQLNEAKQTKDYDAKRSLTEALLQRLDIADIRGEERPKEILDALGSIYAADEYSKVRRDSIMDEIPKDNPDVLVHTLLDEKFSNSTSLLYSLENNDVREIIYQALKDNNAVDKAVTLVSATKDLTEKIRLFEDIDLWLRSNLSNEAKKAIGSYGGYNRLKRDVAVELLSQDREMFNKLLECGVIDIDGLEDRIKDEPDESLAELLLHVITIDDASRVMKFIRNKDALLTTVSELDRATLPQESRGAVVDNLQRLAAAFDTPPQIRSLGHLRKRDENMQSYEIPNKFIIALKDGEDHATIVWSNTRDFGEHKHLAQRIGNISKALCAGGEVGLIELGDGRLQVAFEGRSGTFGPYNHTFLERFKQALAERLQRELNTEIEVVIRPSKI